MTSLLTHYLFTDYKSPLCLHAWLGAQVPRASGEVSFPTSDVHSNTGKENEKSLFFFSVFPFTQPFSHFQDATVNIFGHVNLIYNMGLFGFKGVGRSEEVGSVFFPLENENLCFFSSVWLIVGK